MLRLSIERPGAVSIARDFEGPEVIVGRSEKVDVFLDDSSVSRRHARFFREGAVWLLQDLGSRNGTKLNGRPVQAAERIALRDVVCVGAVSLRVLDPARTAEGQDAAGTASVGQPVSVLDSDTEGTVYSVVRPASELMLRDTAAASRLKMLNEVHKALASPIARGDLLQMVLDRAFAELQPEHAAIFLKGPDGELYRAAERKAPGAGGELLVSRRLAAEVTVKGAAALVLDAQTDERFSAAQSVMFSGVRSILAAPLSDAEGCVGMIALHSRLRGRQFSEPDLELLVSLASAAALRVRNIDLAEAAAERRILERELALARDIQMAMLRRPPARDEIEIATHLVPARSVGGDFYDFLVDGDRLWFVVADVSGKGIGAALMMAVAQTLFRALAASRTTLAELMTRLNRELAHDNERAMFVTALAGCLDLGNGDLQLANAGHNLPYLLRPPRAVEPLAATNAIALGVEEEVTFPISEVGLRPGDGLFVYTDGVCDAVNIARQTFGTKGIERQLADIADRPSQEIVNRMSHAIETFATGTAQEDDITIAVVRYRGR